MNPLGRNPTPAPRPQGLCSRADLLLALARGARAGAAIADLLGFNLTRAPTPETAPESSVAGAGVTSPERPLPAATPTATATPAPAPAATTPALYWQPIAFEVCDETPRPDPPDPGAPVSRAPLTPVPPLSPLAPWPVLCARLESRLRRRREGRALDLDRLVRHLSRGRLIERLPRACRRRPYPLLTILADRSEHLAPYWGDQDQVIARLARAATPGTLDVHPIHETQDPPGWPGAGPLPPPGGLLLVLGDLGCLGGPDPGRERRWRAYALALRQGGVVPLALLPCAPGRCPRPTRALWQALAWERSGPGPGPGEAQTPAPLEALLDLLSPAVRLDPGLVRAVRRLFPAGRCDPGLESDLWQHPAIGGTHREAATWDPDQARHHRTRFAALDAEARTALLALLRRWRRHLPEEIWFEEVLSLDPETRALPVLGDAAARAERFFIQLTLGLTLGLTLRLWEDGDALVVQAGPDGEARGSPWGLLRSGNSEVWIEPLGPRDFWDGEAPDWACGWGWDQYGPWVEFEVPAFGRAAVQRMRWIEPGTFLMGSPEDEPGREPNEGPRHPVTLTQGYWLGDTPCTQALWQGVMGADPSRFQSPDRPVEQVNWHEVHEFIERFEALVPGLALGLPSEAQWERACRAGSESALYTGPIEILGNRHAPALDPIAWYGGNSGVGFELGNGYDSSDWPERQYPDSPSGTHPVKRRQPNAWGLYDMLGNVWEWCEDGPRTYTEAPEIDPLGRAEGRGRVLRGGGWLSHARDCRSADRDALDPGSRSVNAGFRLSRAAFPPAGPATGPRARPARPAPRSGGEAGPGAARGRAGASRDPAATPEKHLTCFLPGGPGSLTAGSARLTLPPSRGVLVLTDRERLRLHRTGRPAWASAMGRDRYGLWSEIAVGSPPVTQRLRWVPPGRFLMGSPADEPGRWEAEGPVHAVIMTRGFWLFDTPCTQALWGAVMGTHANNFLGPRRPVEQVSWNAARAFIDRIETLIPGLGLTLPTEAQWEYACRAGTATALYTGPLTVPATGRSPELDVIARYGAGIGRTPTGSATPDRWDLLPQGSEWTGTGEVGCRGANPWGLYDMLGNVWEWVADPWHNGYEDAPADGSAWTAGDSMGRVIRGGAWNNGPRHCRCACRKAAPRNGRYAFVGFRCARPWD